MKSYPPLPDVTETDSEFLDRGHLWIQELVDGGQMRFRMRGSGALEFGDSTRTFYPGDAPLPYRHAVRHVSESLDRDALRAAVANVEDVVFFGEATHRQSVDYDWGRTPSFLGFDVWSGDRDQFLPTDAVEKIFDRLGLDPVNAVQKEVRAVDFHPERYEMPRSNWYDGPVAGVVLRNKRGVRAKLPNDDVRDAGTTDPASGTPEELAREFATDCRIDAVAERLERRGWAVTAEAVYDRLFESILREEHQRLLHPRADVDHREFRAALAARTREFLDSRA